MLKKMLTLVATASLLAGCIAPKAYVDPNYVKVTAADVKSVAKKHPAKIAVEFRSNGEPKPAVHDMLKAKVENALRSTGVLEVDPTATAFSLTVTVNNIADTSSAASKGFMTGLTLGAAGSVVTDFYDITISYTDASGQQQKTYKHALHTTIGNQDAPFPNVAPTTIDAGFDAILQQVILNFVSDMQKEGKLTYIMRLPTIAP